ncbi:MAG: MlaD family protein, partial [Gammaproteobacteria bacterium]
EVTAHYTRVGLFVIMLTVILIIGGLWLSVGLSGKSYNDYVVYMHESVSGLSTKAPVKYNGVEVGYIDHIDLYRKNPQKVRILLAIEEGTPIYNGTRAVLETQGLTGIAYLELKGGVVSQGLLVAKPGKKYPEIASAPSLLFRLDSALDNLTTNIKDISSSLKDFLNPQNAQAVQNTLQNFSTISNNLEQNSEKLDQIIDNAQITLKNTAVASQQLPSVMTSIKQSSDQLAASANKANVLLTNGATAMQTVNNELMPQIISSMTNIQDIINNVKSVSQQMSEDPSVIVRGKVPAPAGPGE